jgi:pyruvate dehydrogenase E2 component (dihydrolipoamide acetyltransferase)
MTIVIRMPEVLAGATEGAISRWAVAEGDVVNVGDVLAEIETDKASVEYHAEDAGTVARLLAAEGAVVDVGEPIAIFAAEGDTESDIAAAIADAGAGGDSASAGATTATAADAPSSVAEVEDSGAAAISATAPEAGVTRPGDRIWASPIVRKMAKEQGIDLNGMIGSGPLGRIVRRDLDLLVASGATATAPAGAASGSAPLTSAATHATYTEIPHSSMRRAIARRLTESKSTVPHFYLKADCIVDKLLQARTDVNEALGIKTSVNDWVVKAVAHALMAVPAANVVWSDTSMRQFSQADISVAVATEGGLYTPVLRGVERMAIPEINERIRDLADRARQGTIKQDDIEGGSFAVTNLGMFGTEEFSAILNPPQSGILAVGAAREKAVVDDGELAVATVMTVTLSADHRAVDGALAAQWMVAFKRAIEHPLSLLL